MARTAHKRVTPGDLVMKLLIDAEEASDRKFMSGTVIAVDYEIDVPDHHGCEERILVLWSNPMEDIIKECDCALLVLPDIRDEDD